MIFLEYGNRLVIASCQHHLRSSPLALCGGMGIERLLRKILALLQDIIIQVGQNRRIIPDSVLHQQNHLHSRLLDVVVEVHLVLNQFDYREDEVGVSKPAEDIVKHREVLVLHASRYTMRERRQHHARNVGRVLLHLSRHVEGIVVGITRHTYHEVDGSIAQHLVGLLRRTHLSERGRVSQSQVHILVKYLLVHTSVVLQHEGVVWICHYQHVEDASCHDIHKRHILQIKLIPFLRYLGFHFFIVV